MKQIIRNKLFELCIKERPTYEFSEIVMTILNLDGKLSKLFNPCKKCLVQAACSQHRSCDKFNDWLLKQYFCKHDWKVDRLLMNLPTSLMYQCTKCRKIK